MKKNDTVQVEIQDISANGEGIGRADGFLLFIKDTVIGDVVEAKIVKLKKRYGYGRLMKILQYSPNRVEPRCAFHRQCGGCQIQAMNYASQLEFKRNKVENDLKRIGGLEGIVVSPAVGMDEPWHYRNKAQYPIGRDRAGRVVAGFYAGRTHTIIPNTGCCLGVPQNREIMETILEYANHHAIPPYDETTGQGLLRHVLLRYGHKTGELMVCLVLSGRGIPHQEELVGRLRVIEGMASITISVNETRGNVIMGEEILPLWGRGHITDCIGDLRFQISPLSFYQVNFKQTEKIYEKVLELAGLTGEEQVWDLYCGIGTISLFLARKAKKVWGVEAVPQAVEDARKNAAQNGIENVEFLCGKAEDVCSGLTEAGAGADVIVVDPPRKGCDQRLLGTIVQAGARRIVYVSCDSGTLARDLKVLAGAGYAVGEVAPFDNFGGTVHVETVCLLSKTTSDACITEF